MYEAYMNDAVILMIKFWYADNVDITEILMKIVVPSYL
jgi:hypothetical protein